MQLRDDILARLAETDPDRVRAAQLAGLDDRSALMVLYAFHAELAKVPELVSEPLIGEIRYQWWRDALDEIFSDKTVRRHEVVTPLADLIASRDLPRFWLDKLIDGRARDLDPRPFEDMNAARDYARATSGTLMRLAVELLGGVDDATTEASIEAAGEAWGLTGLARSYRFYSGKILQHLGHADICAAASAAQSQIKGKLPAKVMPAIAYAAFVPGYIKIMTRPGRNADVESVHYPPLKKQARLMRAAMTGRIG